MKFDNLYFIDAKVIFNYSYDCTKLKNKKKDDWNQRIFLSFFFWNAKANFTIEFIQNIENKNKTFNNTKKEKKIKNQITKKKDEYFKRKTK